MPTQAPSSHSLRPFLFVTAGFTVVVNILMLVSPLYMLQVYDRVLTSGSVDTLVLISLLAVALLLTYMVADGARRKVTALAADHLHGQYGRRVFRIAMAQPNANTTLSKDLADLSVVQAFFSHGLILPLFDLLFTPLFLVVMFLVHPLIGWIGVGGGALLFTVAIVAELTSRDTVRKAQVAESNATTLAAGLAQQQSAIVSMGMTDSAHAAWSQRKAQASELSLSGAQSSAFFGSLTRSLRLILQIAALGAGAWLVLQQRSSPGVIIAGSILLGRALAPIDQSVGMWRQIVRARQAFADLNGRMASPGADETNVMPMPRPDASVRLDNLVVGCPGADHPLLPPFNLAIDKGTMIALVAPSGRGKTCLLQTIAAAWPALEGQVRLGGRDLHRWDMSDRGAHVGYLPQDVELLPGTVAQNIARFSNTEPNNIVAAARKIGCHDVIMTLPDGYDTVIGPGGTHLSAGQKQLIGIARALFGEPVLLLLDEASANLDQASAHKLRALLRELKEAGTIIICATHDLRVVELADQVMMLSPKTIRMVAAVDYFKTMRGARLASVTAGRVGQ